MFYKPDQSIFNEDVSFNHFIIIHNYSTLNKNSFFLGLLTKTLQMLPLASVHIWYHILDGGK